MIFYVISTLHEENILLGTISRVLLLPYFVVIIIATVNNLWIKAIKKNSDKVSDDLNSSY